MKCDLCNKNLNGQNYIDGKTCMGGWATMCERCHEIYGFGFGNGVGQLYNSKHEKLKG